jgi:predicted unusual protein kinase regulating ubiquinone biosynthesis (AarF/ABC1/UbiB family)
VLTSTWHDGAGLDAFVASAAYAAERIRAARALYEFYVGTLYRHGLFNADPHPGNLLFAPDGRVTILDHGCVRTFEPDLVVWLARLSRAVREDCTRDIQTALAAIGMTNPTRDFDITRAILRGFYAPLLKVGRHRVEANPAMSLRHVARLKKSLLRLSLPGKLLFLFRIRIGLYAVLARRRVGRPEKLACPRKIGVLVERQVHRLAHVGPPLANDRLFVWRCRSA